MNEMIRSLSLVVTLSLPAAVASPASAQAPAPPAAPMPGMPGMPAAANPATNAGDAAGTSAMDKMIQAMSVPPTGNPDRDFVNMMTPHHQGAIDMARVELKYGKDPVLRRMATDIVAAQEKEIAEMRAWQAKHPKG